MEEKEEFEGKDEGEMKEISKEKAFKEPKEFCCPITKKMMADPVMAADGHSYERRAITQWFASNKISYVDKEPVEHTQVSPNKNLKKAIQAFFEKNKQKYQQDFIQAMSVCDRETIFYLEELGIDIATNDEKGWNILHHAVFNGQIEIVKPLLKKGIDINKSSTGWLSLSFSIPETTLLEIERLKQVIQPLNDQIKALQAKPCIWGSEEHKRNDEQARQLYQYIFGPQKEINLLTQAYSKSFSNLAPLHLAIYKKNTKMVEFLIQEKANIEVVDNEGSTPLFWAVFSSNREIIELLMKYNANLFALDKEGNTLLHAAAQYADKETIEFLFKLGFYYKAKNKEEKTPSDIALTYRRDDIAKFITNSGKTQRLFLGRQLIKYEERIAALEQQVQKLQIQVQHFSMGSEPSEKKSLISTLVEERKKSGLLSEKKEQEEQGELPEKQEEIRIFTS